MSRYTSLGIGGPAEVMAFPETAQDLSRILSLAGNKGLPVFILGRGSNLLVLDGGIPGIVLNLSKMSWTEVKRSGGAAALHAGAGAGLSRLLDYCMENGLAGVEFLAGIPGTVGGAVVMNAGTNEAEVKDVLTEVTMMDRGGSSSTVPASELRMSYRHTEIPAGSVVIEAVFAVIPWPREEVREKVAARMRKRNATQPVGAWSAGSTFKNPPGYSAWRLIDMAGLRGRSVGGAQVSTVHTNFLINTGGATARDYKALMDIVVDTVKERLHVALEPEIRVVGVEG